MSDYRTTTPEDAAAFEQHYADRDVDVDRPTMAEEYDEWEAMQQREIEEERYSRTATPGEAHAEWHRNAGVPMGQPGCPQDACHLPDDFEPEPEAGEGIRCAHCKRRHWTVADVKACAGQEPAPREPEAPRWKIGPDPWGPLNTSDEPPF